MTFYHRFFLWLVNIHKTFYVLCKPDSRLKGVSVFVFGDAVLFPSMIFSLQCLHSFKYLSVVACTTRRITHTIHTLFMAFFSCFKWVSLYDIFKSHVWIALAALMTQTQTNEHTFTFTVDFALELYSKCGWTNTMGVRVNKSRKIYENTKVG